MPPATLPFAMYFSPSEESDPGSRQRSPVVPQTHRTLQAGTKLDEDQNREHKRGDSRNHHSPCVVPLPQPGTGHDQPKRGK